VTDFVGKAPRGRRPSAGGPQNLRLVTELAARSTEFRTRWSRYDVAEPGHGAITYAIRVGELGPALRDDAAVR